jgi:hypothetical protein
MEQRFFLAKLIVAQLVKKYPTYYETRRLITLSKITPHCTCPELVECSAYTHILF